MLKVKVPINFLGTVGFSQRREGRYTYNNLLNNRILIEPEPYNLKEAARLMLIYIEYLPK